MFATVFTHSVWIGFLVPTAFGDWPTHRGNSQRTAYREQTIASKEWRPQWINQDLDTPSPAWPAPARGSLWQRLTSIEARVTDDRGDVPLIATDGGGQTHVIVGSAGTDRLISLDPQTGQLQWQFVADGPIRYAPSIDNGVVWFGSDDGMVRAIDLSTGSLHWETRVGPTMPKIVGNSRLISPHPIRTSVLVENGRAHATAGLFPSQGVYSVALNADTGQVVWRRRTQRSPQGYLLADHRQRLVIPCGRSTPFMVSMDSGRYVSECPSAGGTFCMLTREAFFSGPGNHGEVQSYPQLPDVKMLPIQGRSVAAGNGLLWTADGTKLQCIDLSKQITEQDDALIWSVDCHAQQAMIVSGSQQSPCVFVAAENRIEIYDGRTGHAITRLETANAEEQIHYLAVSGAKSPDEKDTLVATTSAGRIVCWHGAKAGSTEANWPSLPLETPGPDTATETIEHSVRAAVAQLPCDAGLALLLNDDSAQFAEELLRTTRLNVVSVVQDRAARDALRTHFLSRRLYGKRITVLHCSDDELPFSPRLFNLVMETRAIENVDQRTQELLPMVDAGNGVVWVRGQAPQKSPPLIGGGIWRHQYAAPSNTSDSGDALVGAADTFRLQWFGGVGPSRMPDRHLRAQAPLAAGSTMVLHGDEWLIGVDPANGIERWQQKLPIDAMRYVMPFDSGYSCLTKDGSTLHTATAANILAINAYTGEQIHTTELPPNASGLRWGCLSETHGNLLASCMKPTAARLNLTTSIARLNTEHSQAGPSITEDEQTHAVGPQRLDRATLRQEYTSDDYDSNRPLVCSRILVSLQSDGKLQWSHPSRGVIPNGSISVDADGSRIVFIEGTSEDCRRHATDRIPVPTIGEQADVVCLNATTGETVWRQPLAWPNAKNILYTQIVDGLVVLATSESKPAGAFYHVRVVNLQEGRTVWESEHAHVTGGLGHGEQVHHPLALRQKSGSVHLIVEPYLYDLHTGNRIVPEGAEADWALKRPGHSCGTLSGAGNCVFFRATNPTVLNLSRSDDQQFQKLSPSRPGCWINMLPVSGRLLIPEGSASCVCSFPLQTSMGFVPLNNHDRDRELPLLADFPDLASEALTELYAWDFRRPANSQQSTADDSSVSPAVGNLPLQAPQPIVQAADGIVLDGKQWLATDLSHADLPAMPATISIEARVSVASSTPQWSGLVGAFQDNGSFERGCLLGIHKDHFFFAIASEQRPALTYLEAPAELEHDRFYHVLGTYDGNMMRLYIDGKLRAVSSAQGGAVIYEQKSWLAAGIYKDNNEHFPLQGTLSFASIFRGAIPSEQVQQRAESN